MIIDAYLIKELEALKVGLNTDKYGVSLSHSARVKAMLDRESLDHSVYMECPTIMNEYRKKNLRSNKSKLRKELKKIRDNLEFAWGYGKDSFASNDGLLSLDYLRDLNGAVQYGNPNRGMYRRHDVRVVGSRHLRAGYEAVETKLDSFIDLDTRTRNVPAIERAANVHLHVAMIHPFDDGNGRTARLVQNLILNAAGFPPLVILAGERDHYGHLLDLAIGGCRLGDDSEKKPFFTYLASKLRVSLEHMAGYPLK